MIHLFWPILSKPYWKLLLNISAFYTVYNVVLWNVLLVKSADLFKCCQDLIGIIFIWFFTLTNNRSKLSNSSYSPGIGASVYAQKESCITTTKKQKKTQIRYNLLQEVLQQSVELVYQFIKKLWASDVHTVEDGELVVVEIVVGGRTGLQNFNVCVLVNNLPDLTQQGVQMLNVINDSFTSSATQHFRVKKCK